MTTYQMIQDMTGADKALVIKCKKSIIGNKHAATSKQLSEIVSLIKKEMHYGSKIH